MMCRMRPDTAVVRVYDATSNVIETHEETISKRYNPPLSWPSVQI
jgi:hypothetical protein